LSGRRANARQEEATLIGGPLEAPAERLRRDIGQTVIYYVQ
jgi:hypothetical protein